MWRSNNCVVFPLIDALTSEQFLQVGVVNAFALGLAMGLRGPVRSPTSCQS